MSYSDKGASRKIRDSDDVFLQKQHSFKSENLQKLRPSHRLPNHKEQNIPTFDSSQESQFKRKINQLQHQLEQTLKQMPILQKKNQQYEKQFQTATKQSDREFYLILFKVNSQRITFALERQNFLQRQILSYYQRLKELQESMIEQ